MEGLVGCVGWNGGFGGGFVIGWDVTITRASISSSPSLRDDGGCVSVCIYICFFPGV